MRQDPPILAAKPRLEAASLSEDRGGGQSKRAIRLSSHFELTKNNALKARLYTNCTKAALFALGVLFLLSQCERAERSAFHRPIRSDNRIIFSLLYNTIMYGISTNFVSWINFCTSLFLTNAHFSCFYSYQLCLINIIVVIKK